MPVASGGDFVGFGGGLAWEGEGNSPLNEWQTVARRGGDPTLMCFNGGENGCGVSVKPTRLHPHTRFFCPSVVIARPCVCVYIVCLVSVYQVLDWYIGGRGWGGSDCGGSNVSWGNVSAP